MSKTILTKQPTGEYTFTDHGELVAHKYTLQRLIHHYLLKGMKRSPEDTKKILSVIMGKINSSFTSLADFQSRAAEIPGWISEPNAQRFLTYIGRHFLSTLEQTRKQLYEKELPAAKDLFDNPYRTPSYDLLALYEKEFTQAPPHPSAGAQPVTQFPFQKSAETPSAPAAENMPSSSAAQPPPEEKRPPGTILLELYGDSFTESPEHPQSSTEQKPAQFPSFDNSAQPVESKSEQPREPLNQPPGARLLELYGQSFSTSPTIPAAPGNTPQYPFASANSPVESSKVSVTAAVFFQLTQKVHHYQTSGDKAGYQAWFSALPPLEKQTLHLKNLIFQEKKGKPVNWQEQYQKLSLTNGAAESDLPGIQMKISDYLSSLQKIRSAARENAPSLYEPLLSFLADDTPSLAALDMLLLQIPDESKKANIRKTMQQVLDNL